MLVFEMPQNERVLPASGPSRGTAGQVSVWLPAVIRRGGAPSGAAALIATGGYGSISPRELDLLEDSVFTDGKNAQNLLTPPSGCPL